LEFGEYFRPVVLAGFLFSIYVRPLTACTCIIWLLLLNKY